MPDDKKIDYKNFSKQIKEQAPQYKSVDDYELANFIIEEYPDAGYGEIVSFDSYESPEKKKSQLLQSLQNWWKNLPVAQKKYLKDLLLSLFKKLLNYLQQKKK